MSNIGFSIFFSNIIILVVSVIALPNNIGLIIGLLGATMLNTLFTVLLLERHLSICEEKKRLMIEKKD